MIASVALMLSMVATSVPDLNALQWHSRVLLIFSPGREDRLFVEQSGRIEADAQGFSERDLRPFALLEPAGQVLRKRFHVKPGEFVVVLIGKDGSEKLRSGHPVDNARLFGLIDSMPMRQHEMKSR